MSMRQLHLRHRSIVSLAALTASTAAGAAHAQVIGTASPGEQTNELGFSLPTAKDLHPGSLPMLQSNDERFSGIPDGVGTKPQWPNPGTSIGGAGQHERHTPAWMAAASRRPMDIAARP